MNKFYLIIMLFALTSCYKKPIEQSTPHTYELSNYTKSQLLKLKQSNPAKAADPDLSASVINADHSISNSLRNHCRKEIKQYCSKGMLPIDCMHKYRDYTSSSRCEYIVNNVFGHKPIKSPLIFYNLTIPAGSIVYKDYKGNIQYVKLAHDIIYKAIVFSKDENISIRNMNNDNSYMDNPFVIEKGIVKSKIFSNGKEYYNPKEKTSFNPDGTIATE